MTKHRSISLAPSNSTHNILGLAYAVKVSYETKDILNQNLKSYSDAIKNDPRMQHFIQSR